jgi:hypothetical protein
MTSWPGLQGHGLAMAESPWPDTPYRLGTGQTSRNRRNQWDERYHLKRHRKVPKW